MSLVRRVAALFVAVILVVTAAPIASADGPAPCSLFIPASVQPVQVDRLVSTASANTYEKQERIVRMRVRAGGRRAKPIIVRPAYDYDPELAPTTPPEFFAIKPGEAGALDPSKTGPGAVPKDQRDKKRTQTRGEKETQLDAQGGLCANCGNPVTVDDVDGHHYPDRHADGGKDFVEVCKDCHKGLHSGKKKP